MKLPTNQKPFLGLLFLLLIASVACTSTPAPTATPSNIVIRNSPTATPPPTATSRPTVTPSPVPSTGTPTPMPTPTLLSPSTIFDRVAPSIAFIETGLGTGSALLIDGGYLLTNAHVVWPYDQVRAVFPDGTEFNEVPVVGWDSMVDLALLGPLEPAPAPPLALYDGEATAIGSDVYLVGYPGEVDTFPQPTITRGLISRKREWELQSITFFQTDATISRGQSGGVLVSEMGEVIGLSGFSFDYGEFGLVASAADLAQRLVHLIPGEDGRPQRLPLPDPETAAREHTAQLEYQGDTAVFLVAGGCGPQITVEAESPNDIVLQLLHLGSGELVEVDQSFSGMEQLRSAVVRDAPYLVSVHQLGDDPARLQLQSTCDLVPFKEDDGHPALGMSESRPAAIDYPFDFDVYNLYLGKGELVNFLIDAASIDPYLRVSYPGASLSAYVEDDDSGGGLFGLNADLTFRAPHAGRYLVMVRDAKGGAMGGYSLTVSRNRAEAPTPVSLPPTPAAIVTDFGEMQLYQSNQYSFNMQVPATWDDVSQAMEGCVQICFAGEHGVLLIVEQNIAAQLGVEEGSVTRQQYVSAVLQNNIAPFPGAVLQLRTTQVTESGLTVEVAHYRIDEVGGTFHLKTMIAFEDGIGFNALYLVDSAAFSELEPVIDYSFRTLGISD